MMSVTETAAALVHACRVAGVDAAIVFQHFDGRDLEAYREALAAPDGIAVPDLHLWMRSTAQTIADGRCLCEGCKTRRAVEAVQADPSRAMCPGCDGRCTGCGTCGGRGWVAA